MTKKRFFLILAAAALLLAILLHLIFYAPLLSELRKKGQECRKMEELALQVRGGIKFLGKQRLGKILISESEVTPAIDEMTRLAKVHGINMVSLSPRTAVKTPSSVSRVFPIDMELESSYRGLGEFLGSLDEMQNGLITVQNFEVVPDGKKQARLKTRLTAQMYLAD